MALGAAVGTDKPTVVVHGDGGFMLHATELATLAQYHLPVIVILVTILATASYAGSKTLGLAGSMKPIWEGCFADMAKSMGVPGTRVKDTNAFNEAWPPPSKPADLT